MPKSWDQLGINHWIVRPLPPDVRDTAFARILTFPAPAASQPPAGDRRVFTEKSNVGVLILGKRNALDNGKARGEEGKGEGEQGGCGKLVRLIPMHLGGQI